MNNQIICPYCGKDFISKQSRAAHYRYCEIHLKELGIYEECKKREVELHARMTLKASELAKQRNKERKTQRDFIFSQQNKECECCGKPLVTKFGSGRFCSRSCSNNRGPRSEDTKRKISQSLIECNSLKLGSNKGTQQFKKGYYHGLWCDSSWELAYVICCELDNVKIERNTCSFEYINPIDNLVHKYYPDFYLPDTQCYVEIKGGNNFFNSDIVTAKNNSLLHKGVNLLYLKDEDMFPFIERVKAHFNILNIESLYDDSMIESVINKKHFPRTLNKIWVYNSVLKKQTLIDKSELDTYINDGWMKGRPCKSTFNR